MYKVEWQEYKDGVERVSNGFDGLGDALDLYRDKLDSGNYYVNLSQTLMQNYNPQAPRAEGLQYHYIENENEDEIEQHPTSFSVKCIKAVNGSFTEGKEYKVLNANGEYRAEDDHSLEEVKDYYHIVKAFDDSDSFWFDEHFEIVD